MQVGTPVRLPAARPAKLAERLHREQLSARGTRAHSHAVPARELGGEDDAMTPSHSPTPSGGATGRLEGALPHSVPAREPTGREGSGRQRNRRGRVRARVRLERRRLLRPATPSAGGFQRVSSGLVRDLVSYRPPARRAEHSHCGPLVDAEPGVVAPVWLSDG